MSMWLFVQSVIDRLTIDILCNDTPCCWWFVLALAGGD